MVYTRSWDEASPAGSVDANTLDTVIQNLKTDMRERLDQIMRDWGDDLEDPKRIKIATGLQADRPAHGDADLGELYYSSDADQLDIAGSIEWNAISGRLSRIVYDDSQSVGNKVTDEQGVARLYSINFTGTTNGDGDVVVDFEEISDVDFSGGDLGFNATVKVRGPNTTTAWARVLLVTTSTITVRVTDSTGTPAATQSVTLDLLLFVNSD